ncbi:hypothetical protein [Bradyrhizobium sp. SBR1B]|nr:hypothetical protein [Bradyrhizobium sp. SBR1B]MBB4377335.1 hypothetical protein [Bradyrhizobium sp. SBR1B]
MRRRLDADDQGADLANSLLEQELADVYAKASHGFLRGRRVPKRKD